MYLMHRAPQNPWDTYLSEAVYRVLLLLLLSLQAFWLVYGVTYSSSYLWYYYRFLLSLELEGLEKSRASEEIMDRTRTTLILIPQNALPASLLLGRNSKIPVISRHQNDQAQKLRHTPQISVGIVPCNGEPRIRSFPCFSPHRKTAARLDVTRNFSQSPISQSLRPSLLPSLSPVWSRESCPSSNSAFIATRAVGANIHTCT